MQSIGRWADASGHPSGAALVADGYTGVFVYAGTPGRAKNVTRAVYADYVAHGLPVIAVYENGIDDISSGAGAQHARDLLADLANVGAPATIPICAAADEHLTAGQVVTAVGYQRDFYRTAKANGWDGLVGGYGFSEFTHAIHDAGLAEFLWQCGSASVLWDGVTFWQRNDDGGSLVGGVQVDNNEQYAPILEDTVSFTDVIGKRPDGSAITAADALANLYLGAYFGGGDAGPSPVFPAVNYLKQTFSRYPDSATNGDRDKSGTPVYDAAENTRRLVGQMKALGAQVAALSAAVAKLATNPAITTDTLQTMLNAAVAEHVQITGTVEIKGQ